MGSIFYDGKILMRPDEANGNTNEWDFGYPHKVPKVYLYGSGEAYNPQHLFSWNDDSVVLARDKHVVKYTRSLFYELLAKNENGEVVWMNGRNAPHSDCWKGEYLDKVREAHDFTIEEYDLETKKKRKYKVSLEEESEVDSWDYDRLSRFVDVDKLGSYFEIKDGVLYKYIGDDAELIIPDGVTEIGYHPFISTHDFDSVSIPKTLVKIPWNTFKQCKAKSINVDKDNPKYYSTDGCLIDKETGTLVWAFATTSIPNDNTIKIIASYAFAMREDLESIVLPDSIQTINNNAFWECNSLKEIHTSYVGLDLSEVISGKSYVRNGDEWTTSVSIPICIPINNGKKRIIGGFEF